MQETAVQKPDSAMQPEHWYDALPRPAYASLERVPVTEDWFEVYRIQPDLYAIYEPGHFQEVISYLITGSEKALLVDTGLGMGNIRKVVEELTSLPVIVMNTHTHFDHIGGNALFDTVYAPITPRHDDGFPLEPLPRSWQRRSPRAPMPDPGPRALTRPITPLPPAPLLRRRKERSLTWAAGSCGSSTPPDIPRTASCWQRTTGSCSSPEIPSIRRRSMWRWHRTVRSRSC
ncbi:MAG: MBL fold metallo-hydrolase [Acutalibacteraceae bacterium]